MSSSTNQQQQYMQQQQPVQQNFPYMLPPQTMQQSSEGQQPQVFQQQYARQQVQVGQPVQYGQVSPIFPKQNTMSQPYGVQQLQMMQTPQIVYPRHRVQHSCCGSYPRTLSNKMHVINFKLGICMLVLGIASVAFGITGFFVAKVTVYHSNYRITYFNVLSFIAPNIWAALFYIVNGALAIAANHSRTNDHLMNAFFAFAILSLIFSVIHFCISFGTIFAYGSMMTVWFNIVSIIISITAFSFALAFIIILGREIYCKNKGANVTHIHYQGTGRVVLPRSLQQAEMAQAPPEYQQSLQNSQAGQNIIETRKINDSFYHEPN